MPSRRLPPLPELSPIQVPASRCQSPCRITGSLPSPISPSHFFAAASSSSLDLSLSIPSHPSPPPSITSFSQPSPRPRSKSLSIKPRSASSFSKVTRGASAWFGQHSARKGVAEAMFEDEQKKRRIADSEAASVTTKIMTKYSHKAARQANGNEAANSSIRHAAWGVVAETMFEDEQQKQRTTESEAAAIATKARAEEDSRKVKEAVKLSIHSLLSRGLRDEECDGVLGECAQMCTSGGLNLSAVLQEPLVNGRPPVYWAILSGPTTTETALHAFVLSLLDHSQPLKETTIASIRLACMLTSNNALLQHLFWHFPALSPLSQIDAMLLSSAAGGDIIDVTEAQDGIGAFVARIQIRRFRLRMRVSKLIKVEFVTSGRPANAFFELHLSLLDVDRIWAVTFSLGTNNKAIESQWWLSFGLGDQSAPIWVDGDFLVLGRLPSVGGDDKYEVAFSLPLGRNPCNLQPGSNSAIKMRLDDGPMRPHLLNGCVSSHFSNPFYPLTPHTGQCHLLTAMEHCMPNSMLSSFDFRPRPCPDPLARLKFLMAQV